MSLAGKVPLMRPGATGRNVVVAIGYFVTMPLWLMVSPFIAFGLVWRDYGGIASSLSRVPGISEGGGVVSGVVAFVIVFVLWGIVGAALPGGDDPGQADPSATGQDIDEPTDTPDASEGDAVTDGGTDTPTTTATESPTATTTATTTATSTETPTSTSTQTPEPTETVTNRERALKAARSGAEGQFADQIRSVEAAPDFKGRDGFMTEVRLDLDADLITGADRAEHMGGTVARRIIKSVVASGAKNVTAVAVYAYVPTTDGGDSVSTKVVVDLNQLEDIDWSSYPWQHLREDADQYKFNAYLYD